MPEGPGKPAFFIAASMEVWHQKRGDGGEA
jgi:hypothetical protein